MHNGKLNEKVVNIDVRVMCGFTTTADFIGGNLTTGSEARIVGGTRGSSDDQCL